MAMTPEQQQFYDALPNGTKITPEIAVKLGWYQGADGKWIGPSGHSYWSGALPDNKQSLGSFLKKAGITAAATIGGAALVGNALGAAGGGSAAPSATAIPSGASALPASAAAPIASSASAAGAAAAGGGGWASWIPKIATVASQVVGGINNRNAIKSAQETQQQATNAALAQQQKAQQAAGDVYTQQRSDFQNMAGQPFQTLGGLLGMNIAPVGPMNGRVVSTQQPMGVPQGLNANVPMETPYPGRPGAPTPELTPVPRGTVPDTAVGSTLKDIERWSSKRKSSSSYGDKSKAKAS